MDVDVLVVDFDRTSAFREPIWRRRADGPRTLGFYSHVDTATRERAVDAGFDLVVPRSRMAREGAKLVTRLAEDGVTRRQRLAAADIGALGLLRAERHERSIWDALGVRLPMAGAQTIGRRG